MSLENDWLLRNIYELASALMTMMGLAEGDEENLEEIEVEAETHLGMPISAFEKMPIETLMSFTTMQGGPNPRRMMLLGLVLAARCELAAEKDQNRREGMLRPKAIKLLETAFDMDVAVRTDDITQVLETLIEDQEDADAAEASG